MEQVTHHHKAHASAAITRGIQGQCILERLCIHKKLTALGLAELIHQYKPKQISNALRDLESLQLVHRIDRRPEVKSIHWCLREHNPDLL